MKLPDRWLKYKNSARIRGTRFVAFKVPLKKEFFRNLPPDISFTPKILLKTHPNIKIVIDFTFTTKYYNGVLEFEKRGIRYIKIKCRGHVVPEDKAFQKFSDIVDDFLEKNPDDCLIGVHCTHGVNRTGYFVVRYMIEKLGYSAAKSLREFLQSRGHAIERTKYIVDLHQRDTKTKHSLNKEV